MTAAARREAVGGTTEEHPSLPVGEENSPPVHRTSTITSDVFVGTAVALPQAGAPLGAAESMCCHWRRAGKLWRRCLHAGFPAKKKRRKPPKPLCSPKKFEKKRRTTHARYEGPVRAASPRRSPPPRDDPRFATVSPARFCPGATQTPPRPPYSLHHVPPV